MHGEPLAGAGQAGLDLVGHEKDAVGVAQAAQLQHELGRRRVEAALALDRLDDDRGDPARLDDRPEQTVERGMVSATRTPCRATGNGTWWTSAGSGPNPAL